MNPTRSKPAPCSPDRIGVPRFETGRLAILAGPDYAGLAAVARSVRGIADAPAIIDAALRTRLPADVAKAEQAWTQLQFQAQANEQARRASAGRYLLQTLANAPRVTREGRAEALDGLWTGRPAVIVAAGPSLDRNIRDLPWARERALVISCDTAAGPLAYAGADPDFIVATDPSRANAGHLSSLPAMGSWLVAEGALHASAFAHFDRRTFFFRVGNHEPWPWLRGAGLDCRVLETWGSVATSAFSLALAMGCDPIVFAGADLAFTGGHTYARGTSFEPRWAFWAAAGTPPDAIWQQLMDQWPDTTATDIHGDAVRTASHLISFRDWIVERAQAHPDRRVVNTTGAGLLHGPAIAQLPIGAILADRPSIDRQALHQTIRHAHGRHATNLGRLLASVTLLLGGGDDALHRRWIEFTASTVTKPAIEAALRSSEYLGWTDALTALSASLPETKDSL